MMTVAGKTRQELENDWRERLDDRLRRYRIAKEHASKAQAVTHMNDTSDAQELFAFRMALRAETIALAEYKRVLIIFNAFVIDGKIPGSEA